MLSKGGYLTSTAYMSPSQIEGKLLNAKTITEMEKSISFIMEDYYMKKLGNFLKFDFVAWQTGKKFIIQSVKFNEKKGCVTLDVVIVDDATDYGDATVSNIYEKFKVNLINDTSESDVNKYHIQNGITFKSFSKATVWGDYNSQLSVDGVVEVIK